MELTKKEEKVTKGLLINEKVELGLLFITIFAIPFFFKSPQYVIGTVVNLLLILSVSKYGLKKMFPALILPSLATYLSGRIFGGATNSLLYIMPFIMLSNLIYVLLYQKVKIGFLNVVIASITKASFLFLAIYILYKTVGLPELFLTTMGVTQLITAFSGGTLGYLITSPKKKGSV